jgi:hypothetical protein
VPLEEGEPNELSDGCVLQLGSTRTKITLAFTPC